MSCKGSVKREAFGNNVIKRSALDVAILRAGWIAGVMVRLPDLLKQRTALHPNTPATCVIISCSCLSTSPLPPTLFTHSQKTATAGEEKVISSPLTRYPLTPDRFLPTGRSMSWFVSIVLDRDHGRILKTFTRLGTRELRHRPMGATGAQSRLRQLQTNLVTVNPECNFGHIVNTHHPTRPGDTSKTFPFLRPKQKQNRKHDDTEKTP